MADGDHFYIVRDANGWNSPAVSDRELLVRAERGAITPESEIRDPITKWTGTAWDHPLLRAAFVRLGVAGPEAPAAVQKNGINPPAVAALLISVLLLLCMGVWWMKRGAAGAASPPHAAAVQSQPVTLTPAKVATIETASGAHDLVGTVTNSTHRMLATVRVEAAFTDRHGKSVGVADVSTTNLNTGKTWRFSIALPRRGGGLHARIVKVVGQ